MREISEARTRADQIVEEIAAECLESRIFLGTVNARAVISKHIAAALAADAKGAGPVDADKGATEAMAALREILDGQVGDIVTFPEQGQAHDDFVRSLIARLNRVNGIARAAPAATLGAGTAPDGLSEWAGWDQGRPPWGECKHKDAVLEALFRGPWSVEDAATLIGFIDRTWSVAAPAAPGEAP